MKPTKFCKNLSDLESEITLLNLKIEEGQPRRCLLPFHRALKLGAKTLQNNVAKFAKTLEAEFTK